MTFSLATVFVWPSDFGSLFIGFAHNVMHNVTLKHYVDLQSKMHPFFFSRISSYVGVRHNCS